jgi:GDP-L-fucose synthase
MNISKDAKIYIAGHRGLAGGAIWRKLESLGYQRLIGRTSKELDLTERELTFKFIGEERPDVIVDAAARVGGIQANNSFPAEFLSENLQIQTNLMDAANKYEVDRLLFLGSSCIYPKLAMQPIKEDSLLTGALEPTNDAYAIAKIAGIMQVQASRRQYGRHWISAMPTNLYGPGDNFHPEHSHVLPALMRRIHEAKINNMDEVVIWGSGTPRREFLYVDDLADACIFLLNNYDSPETINVGVGADVSITELALLISEVVGYKGILSQDLTKPDGTPQKLLDVTRINSLGWEARITLAEGISKTYKWFLENEANVRSK